MTKVYQPSQDKTELIQLLFKKITDPNQDKTLTESVYLEKLVRELVGLKKQKAKFEFNTESMLFLPEIISQNGIKSA